MAILLSGCGANYYLKSGKKDFSNLQYAKAKKKFNNALAKKPESYESLKMLALTHQKLDDFPAAEKAYQLAMNYPQVTLEDKFNYGKMLMSNNKHDKAELIFREYLSVKPEDKVARAMVESCQFIELFKDDTALYKISALPMLSNLSMFSPVMMEDGSLAFTAEREVKGSKNNPWTGNSYYDLYSMKNNGSTWNEQMPIDKIFNGKFHDGPISFNKANDMAVFTRSYTVSGRKAEKDGDNFNNMFLYTASKDTSGAWGNVIELPFNNIDYSCMHPSLSEGGDTLYFASDMPGGIGQNDIYMSTNSGGSWSKPKNLGSTINTKANEVFPTYRGGNALYFSSDGHPSLGELDIFKSTKSGDEWKKPRNLNYPINSTSDDFSFIYDGGDSTGYFASNRQGVDKIYQFKKRPSGNVYVNGKSVDDAGNLLKGVTIKLIDLDTGETIKEVVTGPDGKFDFELLPDRNYRIEGSKDGYFTQSYERSTVNQYEDEELELVFTMPQINVIDPNSPYTPDDKGVIRIPNINYDFDKFDIRPDAAVELDKVVKTLKDNPTIVIELQSHTDSRGRDEYNVELSERRARSAKAYLVQKGIAVNRIVSKGYGETRILNKCVNGADCSDEAHEENRRTEFIVTSLGK